MIIQGNALRLPIKSESVDCCVTSPPYWGLRDYGVSGQLGLEKTPEEYVAKMVEVFGEVKRVLKKEGTLWLNIGDSYWGGGNYRGTNEATLTDKQRSNRGAHGLEAIGREYLPPTCRKPINGAKPKDLVGIPWLLAFALRADGWYLRSDIIWHKPNPMPESVTDRPTKAHEYVFLMSKSSRYFYDAEAVKEKSIEPPRMREKNNGESAVDTKMRGYDCNCGNDGSRNLRTVWSIATAPFSEAHFATFPPALAERCIKAGTSEKGVCPGCGKAWVRTLERIAVKEYEYKTIGIPGEGENRGRRTESMGTSQYQANGWLPQCSCNLPPIPALVFDPFGGAGTVDLVAKKLNRRSISIELKGDYCTMAKNRIENQCGTLF
jgi:DNA modification methylase